MAGRPDPTTSGEDTAAPAGTEELRRALERTARLAQEEAIRIESLLDRVETLQAEAEDLARAGGLLCKPTRTGIVDAFTRLLASPAWRRGSAIGNGWARLRGRPVWGLTQAVQAECRALSGCEPAGGHGEPWTREQAARLEHLHGLASLLLGSRRFRAGRVLALLLGSDRGGDRAAHELACLLRVAREQVSAARTAREAGLEEPTAMESCR